MRDHWPILLALLAGPVVLTIAWLAVVVWREMRRRRDIRRRLGIGRK